jgi:hypothetical protein
MGSINRRITVQACLGKTFNLIPKITKAKRVGDMAQVVKTNKQTKCLPRPKNKPTKHGPNIHGFRGLNDLAHFGIGIFLFYFLVVLKFELPFMLARQALLL